MPDYKAKGYSITWEPEQELSNQNTVDYYYGSKMQMIVANSPMLEDSTLKQGRDIWA